MPIILRARAANTSRPLKIGRLRGNQLNEHGETRHRVICRNEKQRPGDEMSGYEDTLKDIEETFGIVPGFMKALPQEVLCLLYTSDAADE